MIICHFITSLDKSSGGPPRSLKTSVEMILESTPDFKIIIFSLESSNMIDFKKHPNLEVILLPKNYFKFKNKVSYYLRKHNPDLIHIQGIWEFKNHVFIKLTRKLKIPYLISTRGMLEAWSLKVGWLKKRVALIAYQKRDLKFARCIHATAKSEEDSIKNILSGANIEIVPNSIDLVEFPDYVKKENQIKKILFLSRIHHKKGIELLINSWRKIDKKLKENWEVEIVGNGDEKYIQKLNNIISSMYLENEVKITKPVFNQDKIEKYRSANLFVLPTYSENFGVVVAESLACKVPVITTKGTPWQDLESFGCGKWIDIGEVPLKKSLEEMLLKTFQELLVMGENGRKLVMNNYNSKFVSEDMAALYKRLK